MFLTKLRAPLHNRFLKNIRLLNNVSDKGIKKIGNLSMDWSSNNSKWWWEYEYMPKVLMAGAGIGTCIGSYNGYENTKGDTYAQCLFMTLWSGWLGGTVGYLSTLVCPITVPIVIAVTIARQMEPEKKVSDDKGYTLRPHRP
jgi:hypothetical protein